MLAELATFSLALALVASLLQGSVLFWPRLRPVIPQAASVTALLVFAAFAALVVLRVDSDFSVANVAQHSNRALPLLYKVAGTWGNHEGSMLLWALVIAVCGALLASPRRGEVGRGASLLRPNRECPLPPTPSGFGGRCPGPPPTGAGVQGLLTAGVLAFILFTSNPFARIFPPPADGVMLNPLLQDVALSIHPPLLYLGYVGFSSVFSLAIAGLLNGRIDSDWARRAHGWIMASWAFLTMGIALGSWWAYRELGWGGFWFWDPVENASLLPWLAGTALLHSNIVLKKRGLLAGWVALLSILTFGLSLIGTFLVRSGAITSVHSFASDPTRGIFILAYLALAIGGGLWLYGARIGRITATAPLRPASREGAIVINNLFFITACATVLLGTLYPLAAEVMAGERLTVGAPYFNATFLPLMSVPLFIAAFSAYLPWKKAQLAEAVQRAWPAWTALSAVVIMLGAVVAQERLLAVAGFGLSAFLLAASMQWLARGAWRRGETWPVFLAHAGAALLVLGITGVGLWSRQVEGFARGGSHFAIAGYEVKYQSEEEVATPNYTGMRADLRVTRESEVVANLYPEHRRYLQQTTTSEAAIYSTIAYDIYAVIGEREAQGTPIRLYFRPTIFFVWLGAALMAMGGLVSVSNTWRRK